jgi:hypothetical protein
MAWVSSLRSVSSSRLPGRTCPRGRWLGVCREAALAAARSLLAAVRARPAAGPTVAAVSWLAGPNPCGVDRVGDPALGGGQLGAGVADLVAGAGFGGVGDHPGRVVGLVGVAVQGAGGEVFAGAFEVVLLPPAGSHPVGDLRGA